jgi:hypothetical protein
VSNIETSLKYTHGSASNTVKFQPGGKFTWENECKPEDFNEDGQITSFKTVVAGTPNNGSWDLTWSPKISIPKFSEVQAFFAADVTYKSTHEKLVKASLHAKIADDFHIGAEAAHNLEALKDLTVQAGWKHGDYFLYLKSLTFQNKLTLGGMWKIPDWYGHVTYAQATFNVKGEKGFGSDLKASITEGFSYENMVLKNKLQYNGTDFWLYISYIHKFNNQFKLVVGDKAKINKLLTDPKGIAYNFGVAAEFNL